MRALRLVPRDQEVSCLDLGTGSGVIGICLVKYLPRASVTAVDISEDALALAKENAELNNVSDRIVFLTSDWFEKIEGRFDFILANPPYIPQEELGRLPVEVRDHEPEIALDGGKDGVEEIARIAGGAREHLRRGGTVLLEIGDGQGARVSRILTRAGLVNVRVEHDLAEKERFVIAQCP